MFIYNTEICVLTYLDESIKIYLLKNDNEEYFLPGKLVANDETARDRAYKLLKKHNITENGFLRHIAVFDDPQRDFRGNVISNIFYYIIRESDITEDNKKYFKNIEEISSLSIAFDQKEIICKAKENVKKDLLETMLAQYFLEKEFTIPELQKLLLCANDSKEIKRTHFFTKIKNKTFIEEAKDHEGNSKFKSSIKSKRPAKLYVFKTKANQTSIYY